MNINELNREQLIEYAKQFNIFKVYKFPEYIEERDLILKQMNILKITEQEVMPVRIACDESVKVRRV